MYTLQTFYGKDSVSKKEVVESKNIERFQKNVEEDVKKELGKRKRMKKKERNKKKIRRK